MKISYWLLVVGWGLGMMFLGAGVVKAALVFGSGYYTNLCDSGTEATYYSCDKRCNVATGACTSSNDGVVKYICLGKWNQCLESESGWSNFEQVRGVVCGYTVQLSLFDKKCRNEDGSWNSSCQLLGYLVWYSGDCRPTAIITPTTAPVQAVIISKLSNLSAVLGGVSPTIVPSVTPQPTTPAGVNICGTKCTLGVDCAAGFACITGVCRNPACTGDINCFCQQGGSVVKPVVSGKATPDTGVETWLGMAGMVILGLAGFKLRKMARKVW